MQWLETSKNLHGAGAEIGPPESFLERSEDLQSLIYEKASPVGIYRVVAFERVQQEAADDLGSITIECRVIFEAPRRRATEAAGVRRKLRHKLRTPRRPCSRGPV